MEQNRFFRVVWRFNALLLALGGVFILTMAGWSLLGTPPSRPSPEGGFRPVPKGAEKAHTYRLTPLQLNLARETLFQLGRWDGAPNVYGLQEMVARPYADYGGPDTVNLLAVDGSDGAGHWLFHGFDREIVSEIPVTNSGGRPDIATATPIALVIRTIDADTDKDGKRTNNDRQSLYVYRPGFGFAAKLVDVDFLQSMDQPDGAHFLVVYERGKTAYAASYSLPDFKRLSEKALPDVPD